MTNSATASPTPYPIPRGAGTAAFSESDRRAYVYDSVSHVRMTLLRRGVVVFNVSVSC